MFDRVLNKLKVSGEAFLNSRKSSKTWNTIASTKESSKQASGYRLCSISERIIGLLAIDWEILLPYVEMLLPYIRLYEWNTDIIDSWERNTFETKYLFFLYFKVSFKYVISLYLVNLILSDAVSGGVLWKKMFLGLEVCNFIWKERDSDTGIFL